MFKDLFLRCSDEIRERYLSLPGMARECQPSLEGDAEYCLIDFETTGFDPVRDRVIEVAATRVVGDDAVEWCESLINPGVAIPPHIRLLTGIEDEMVRESPSIEEFFPTLREFIGDLTIVAYSRFEAAFLREMYSLCAGERFDNPYIDALDLAIMVVPSLRSHRQADLASVWEIEAGQAHRATDDVRALVGVFRVLLNGVYNLPLPLLRALDEHAPAQPGGLSLLVRRVLAERSGGRPVERLKLDGFINGDTSWEEIPPLEGEPGIARLECEEVRSVFAADGPLAGQFSDYEERDEQLQMAEATRAAFDNREILLVEAGTGTGKSLAYLVPGMMWAKVTGLPVVVSTRTLNLQDQLFTKDLPLLERALAPGWFRYSVLKGYSNYLCPRKLQGLINGKKSLAEDQLAVLGMLLMWLHEGGNGDVSLLNVSHLRGLNYHLMADHRECPGERCSFARRGRCCYRKALYRAKRSHVVVVNHSLLLAGVSLSFVHAVIDEAHTLEDVATEQFTVEVDYRETRRFLEFLYSPLEGSGFLADLASTLEAHIDSDAVDGARVMVEQAQAGVEDSLENLERLFIALSEFYEGESPGTEDLRFTAGIREMVPYLRLEETANDLEASLENLVLRLARVSATCEEKGDGTSELEYAASDLAGKLTRLSELKDALGVVLLQEREGNGLVHWATVGHAARFEYQALRASPIDVGPSLKEGLYDTLEAAVLTSATLTVKDSFDFFCSRVGLDMLERDRLKCLVLDSSFDYARQMQILILHDMPEPGSREYGERIPGILGDVIRASGGGVLALFTNRRLMMNTYQALVDELQRDGFPLLCQQPGYSRRRLAEEFVEDSVASLFGTTSFWEGVDARGSTLRLVAVTRIPFESPGRPVFEARSELVREQGLSDFSSFSLPLAALRLKQGVGRLIRTRQDVGQVLIMDSRISSKQYGQVLLRSLPGARRRRVSLDEVGRAIEDFQRRSNPGSRP